jgi:hypothetical protein
MQRDVTDNLGVRCDGCRQSPLGEWGKEARAEGQKVEDLRNRAQQPLRRWEECCRGHQGFQIGPGWQICTVSRDGEQAECKDGKWQCPIPRPTKEYLGSWFLAQLTGVNQWTAAPGFSG